MIYRLADLTALSLSTKHANDPLVRRKQLIYVGKFTKHDQKSGKELVNFEVTPELIDHWNNTHWQMSQMGVEVPAPNEHTTDAAARKGTWFETETGVDDKGRYSLFGYIRFKDQASLDAHKDGQVSVYVPPKATHQGRTFWTPIEHAALTDYPVIPGMDKFKALAASIISELPTKMADHPLRGIARRLSIADTVPDDQLETAILDAKSASDSSSADSSAPASEGDNSATPPAIAAALIKQMRRGREAEIAALSNKLVPAAIKKLKEVFVGDAALSLSVTDERFDKMYEDVMAVLKAQPAMTIHKERSGPQLPAGTLPLSNADAGDDDGKPKRKSLVEKAQELRDKADKKAAH
jgi:hypothetical protein